MIFSISNDGNEWSLEFGPESVTRIIRNLVQEVTIALKFPPAARSLLLYEGQDFLNNHLAWIPITSKQEGTLEMREEVLLSVGAQDLDTSEYQLSDLDDVEFYWESVQLDVHAVFRPGINKPFPFNFKQLWDSLKGWKSESDWRRARQGELSVSSYSSHNSCLRETNPTYCVDEKLPLRCKIWDCSRLCLKDFVRIIYTLVTASVF